MSKWTKEQIEAVMDRFAKVFEESVVAAGGTVLSSGAAQHGVQSDVAVSQ